MLTLTDYLKELNEGKHLSVVSNLGYVITPNCIRRCLRLSQEEKMLLFEIYSLYNEGKKSAFPTQQTLAMYVGTSSSNVSKHLKRLEQKGFISSKGRKGKKKEYYPSFNLHVNPYILLSELFHFATKTINAYLPDSIGGEWANKLLQFVNVRHSEEFSKNDSYGRFLNQLRDGWFRKDEIMMGFLYSITNFVEDIVGSNLKIDWEKEVESYKSRTNLSSKKHNISPNYKKSSLSIESDYIPKKYNLRMN